MDVLEIITNGSSTRNCAFESELSSSSASTWSSSTNVYWFYFVNLPMTLTMSPWSIGVLTHIPLSVSLKCRGTLSSSKLLRMTTVPNYSLLRSQSTSSPSLHFSSFQSLFQLWLLANSHIHSINCRIISCQVFLRMFLRQHLLSFRYLRPLSCLHSHQVSSP